MRAYQVRGSFGIDSLVPVELPEPKPGPGEVLVRVRAVSLNYRDLLVVTGAYNRHLPLPLIPVSDGAGEVVALGPGVTRFKPGDWVVAAFFQNWVDGPVNAETRKSALGGGGPGMLAELVVLREAGLLPVPGDLSLEEAATLPCAGVTAWHALQCGTPLRPGETVLVQGSGGVSVFALQFAHALGARVIATSGSEAKRQRLAALGADATINYRDTPEWDAAAVELTKGVGVDRIVEVGGAGTLPRSLRAVRVGGLIVLIGVLAGRATFDPTPVIMRSLRIEGIGVGPRTMFEAMNRAIVERRLRPVIDRTFAAEAVQDAFRHMAEGAHFGKICVAL